MTGINRGTLLLVIPPVVRSVGGLFEVESDFAHNLRLYLSNFTLVKFACPVFPGEKANGIILRSLPFHKIKDAERLSFIPLPYAYREDRYLRHYLKTRRLLRSEISQAEYLIFSPHAKFDWSTLAARQAIKLNRKYDMESDHDHTSGHRFNLSSMRPGIKKLRKAILGASFLKSVEDCFSHSTIALLQGQDVFDAYKNVAPNRYKVLNVQVSSEDHITPAQLAGKLDRIERKERLSITYAGQAIPRKGPIDWLKAIHLALEAGAKIEGTWFGDGPMLPQAKLEAANLGLEKIVKFPGPVSHGELIAALQTTDIFLFCHKTGESPRCLGEALATGCALVGYGTQYPLDLTAIHGGGEFAQMDDWKRLAEIIVSLDRDRGKLRALIMGAAASGRLLDRDIAMQKRIDLIKRYLTVCNPPACAP
jgi:colanic acid/amylovoran biosynthesis glycosyltransferase